MDKGELQERFEREIGIGIELHSAMISERMRADRAEAERDRQYDQNKVLLKEWKHTTEQWQSQKQRAEKAEVYLKVGLKLAADYVEALQLEQKRLQDGWNEAGQERNKAEAALERIVEPLRDRIRGLDTGTARYVARNAPSMLAIVASAICDHLEEKPSEPPDAERIRQEILSDPQAMRDIEEGIEDMKAGRGTPWYQVAREMGCPTCKRPPEKPSEPQYGDLSFPLTEEGKAHLEEAVKSGRLPNIEYGYQGGQYSCNVAGCDCGTRQEDITGAESAEGHDETCLMSGSGSHWDVCTCGAYDDPIKPKDKSLQDLLMAHGGLESAREGMNLPHPE